VFESLISAFLKQGVTSKLGKKKSRNCIRIIERTCVPSIIIVFDGLAACPGMQQKGYEFSSVNHSEFFLYNIGNAYPTYRVLLGKIQADNKNNERCLGVY
jgi:hypothetical protein